MCQIPQQTAKVNAFDCKGDSTNLSGISQGLLMASSYLYLLESLSVSLSAKLRTGERVEAGVRATRFFLSPSHICCCCSRCRCCLINIVLGRQHFYGQCVLYSFVARSTSHCDRFGLACVFLVSSSMVAPHVYYISAAVWSK